MPEFDYEYADRQGNLHQGSMVADSGRDKAWTAMLHDILDIISYNP